MNREQILKLLRQHVDAIEELKVGGVLRTDNNPVSDYAEYLVSKKFNL